MIVYLYVKTHLDTGLRYFGKTTEDPFKYKGSGKYWKRHLEIHGDNVETVVVRHFNLPDDEDLLVDWALQFSSDNNIVESEEWANMIPENGLDGRPVGVSPVNPYPQSARNIQSVLSKTRWEDPEYRARLSEAHKNAWTEERKASISESMRNRPDKDRIAMENGRTRWHKEQALKDNPYDWLKGPKSAEHRRAISAGMKGKSKSEQHRRRMSEIRKNMKPTKVPSGAEWIRPGEYKVKDFRVVKIKKNRWSVETSEIYLEKTINLNKLVDILLTDPGPLIRKFSREKV